MKNEKFDIVLDDYERRIIVNSLNQMRSQLKAESIYKCAEELVLDSLIYY